MSNESSQPEYKRTFWDELAIMFGTKREWEIIDQATRTVSHFYVDRYTGKKTSERTVEETWVIERCKITGKERAHVYYGAGSLFLDYTPEVAKARITIQNIKNKKK